MKRTVGAFLSFLLLSPAFGSSAGDPITVLVDVNRSVVLENAVGVKRISVANPEMAEIVAISRKEIVINGKAPGQTSLVLWDTQGQRTAYEVHISPAVTKAQIVSDELKSELPGQDVHVEVAEGSVFLRGTVNDLVAADRAASIASTLGKVVNLLKIKVPQSEPQILLKVRFANVDRTAATQFGFNLLSTGATNTIGTTSTGQFGVQPTVDLSQTPAKFDVHDLLNIFLFRRDLNLGATIQALQAKQILEILAEPNLLTVSGRPASFLAGGEFPFPTLQGGGGGVGQVTVSFREFGVRIHFLPIITPRGTIRMSVTPEVSALNYANSLTVGGVTVPGLSTRRVETEVELQSGQSFAIAGLIDNRTTEILNKIPGLANIPLFGKLFESRSIQKSNSELLVLVTPEIVDPVNVGDPPPNVIMPAPFLKDAPTHAPEQPASPNQKLNSVESLPQEVIRGWLMPADSTKPQNTPAPNVTQPLAVPDPGNGSSQPAPAPISAKVRP